MRVFAFAVLLIWSSSYQAQAEPIIRCDGQEENLKTYLQMHEILFMDRDTSRVSEFYADEIISHNNDRGEGSEVRVVTPKDMAARWDKSRELNPGRVLEDELILCADEFVIVRTLVKSNFVEPLAGIEPTGEPYHYTATDIYRFEDGKVVERWGNNDMAYVYRQLGFDISRD